MNTSYTEMTLCSTRLKILAYVSTCWYTHTPQPTSITAAFPPPPEWKQLELVLSHLKTDWCDTAFQTTSLSSPRVISVPSLQAFNKKKSGRRVGHPLASIWQAGRLCQYHDLCGSRRDSPIVGDCRLATSVIELVSREGTEVSPLGLVGTLRQRCRHSPKNYTSE